MTELTNEQIENLHHTSMKSFYHKQPERFEIMDHAGKALRDIDDEKAHLRWYKSQLEALFAFNYFAKKHNVALLWDMAENPEPQYCLLIDIAM